MGGYLGVCWNYVTVRLTTLYKNIQLSFAEGITSYNLDLKQTIGLVDWG